MLPGSPFFFGAAAYVESFSRQMEEKTALAGDGSSAETLALALSRFAPALPRPQGNHSELDVFVRKMIAVSF